MASISSLMGSSGSSSSIYGNKNIISGLATGMDTEAMIENAIKGQKMKISHLEKLQTKVQWEQEAYRSIITKLSNFTQKYGSFTSSTNLSSPSFFDSAVEILAHGANANKVSAVGNTSSTVQINSVTSLASAAKYNGIGAAFKDCTTASQAIDINTKKTFGTLQGSLALKYGNSDITISFDENDVYQTKEEMVASINKKLEGQTIKLDDGSEVKASDKLHAVVQGDTISFAAKDGTGTVTLTSADDTLKNKLGITVDKDNNLVNQMTWPTESLTVEKSYLEIVAEKGFKITVDGVTKTVNGPTSDEVNNQQGANQEEKYIAALQAKINEAFGAGKLTVSDDNGSTAGIQLKFSSPGNTQFSVQSGAADILGMEGGAASSINLDQKLGDLLNLDPNDAAWAEGVKVNDAVIQVTKDTTLRELMDKINSDAKAGVTVSYSSFNNQFTFTAKETGANGKVQLGGLASKMFGEANVTGTDAEFNVTVNGQTKTVKQNSNTINIDGMKITMNETFDTGEAVTFTSRTDTDKIMDAIKSMVNDYNELAKEIKTAYGTIPPKNSKGDNYEPLSDEDRKDMSESEIRQYEEKAKSGLLFADRELSDLYQRMTEALGVFGTNGSDAQNIGITTTFKDGLTTLSIDEEKLRKALETEPDKVKDIFTRKAADGGRPGLMEGLVTQFDKYGATSGADKGILVKKAGSPLAPTTILQNEMQKKIDDYDKRIDIMRVKIADQIDYYNRKFSALEQLVAQMNNQSSSLMGMMGGF